jgi:hypothetical protein
MKYIGTDGEVGECEGLNSSIVDFLSINDGQKVILLPKPEQNYSLVDLIQIVKKIVAIQPPYLPADDIPWMLAYMEEFSRFVQAADSDKWQHFSFDGSLIKQYATHGTRRFHHEDTEKQAPNFIDLARRFTCLEIIHAHLYGFDLPACMFSKNSQQPDSSALDDSRLNEEDAVDVLGILRDEPYSMYNPRHPFPRDGLDFFEEKRFKTVMSQNFFKRASAAFLIPEGMEIDFDLDDENLTLKSGNYGIIEIDRFYKTQGGWYDGGGPAGYPNSSSDEMLYSMMFIPTIKCNIGEKNILSKALEINIPLNWITHFVQMPYDWNDRDFTISKIKTHKVQEPEDLDYDLAVQKMVSDKVTKYADGMEEMMNNLYRPRS